MPILRLIFSKIILFFLRLQADSGDDSSPVLCLITRTEDEIPIETTMHQRNLEQLTIQIDATGRIMKMNTAALRPAFVANMAAFVENLPKGPPRSIHDLCHLQDQAKLQAHVDEVLQTSSAQSVPYRLRIGGADQDVYVKANSRLFRNSADSDFIMSVNTILSDNEVATMETHGSTTALSLPSTSHQQSSTSLAAASSHMSGMGGPLMSSVINGGINHVTQQSAGRSNSVVTSYSSPPTNDTTNAYLSEPFFSFPDSLDGMESVGAVWDSRPDSRTSVTSVSTPRPPSVPAFSPAASICPSPLTSYHAGQPSPSNNNNNNNNLNNNNSFGGYSSFAYYDEKDTKDQIQQQLQQQPQQMQPQAAQLQLQQQQQQQQSNESSERLRILLTKRPHSNTSSSGVDADHEPRSANKILKGLLNADEDKDNGSYKFNPLMSPRNPQPRPRQDNKGGKMLLQVRYYYSPLIS